MAPARYTRCALILRWSNALQNNYCDILSISDISTAFLFVLTQGLLVFNPLCVFPRRPPRWRRKARAGTRLQLTLINSDNGTAHERGQMEILDGENTGHHPIIPCKHTMIFACRDKHLSHHADSLSSLFRRFLFSGNSSNPASRALGFSAQFSHVWGKQ